MKSRKALFAEIARLKKDVAQWKRKRRPLMRTTDRQVVTLQGAARRYQEAANDLLKVLELADVIQRRVDPLQVRAQTLGEAFLARVGGEVRLVTQHDPVPLTFPDKP